MPWWRRVRTLVELGVPFSDPMADGPVIQRASERALAAGMTFGKVLDLVCEFRKRDEQTPIVLMGYLNPLEAVGYTEAAGGACGGGGGSTGSLPWICLPEEAEELVRAVRSTGIDPVFLISPTSSDERIVRICRAASGIRLLCLAQGGDRSGEPRRGRGCPSAWRASGA